jgi:capsular polysaccharide biosynthesis protein/Mrp family chromosome partitioning ATPase
MDLSELGEALVRRRLLALWVLVVVFAALAVFLTVTPRTYSAVATLSAAPNPKRPATDDLSDVRATLARMVGSQIVLHDVSKRIQGVRTVEELDAEVTGEVVKGTTLIQITAEDGNAAVAADIANAAVAVLPRNDPSAKALLYTTTDRASVSKVASHPDVPLVLGGGTVLGILLAVAIALIRDRIPRRRVTANQLERATDIGVLCEIAPPNDPANLPALYPGTPAAKSFRSLRVGLEAALAGRSTHTLVVTAADRTENDMWLGANLAIALAQVKHRVLLVDARFGDDASEGGLAAPDAPGLLDVLLGTPLAHVVLAGPVEDLSVLPVGDRGGVPTEALVELRFTEVMQEAATMYDVAVVVAAPLSVSDDAVVMAASGSLLTVVPSDLGSLDELGSQVDRLRAIGIRLVGSVLLTDAARRGRG